MGGGGRGGPPKGVLFPVFRVRQDGPRPPGGPCYLRRPMSRDPDLAAPPATRPAEEAALPRGGRIAVVVNGNAKSVTAQVIATLDQILDSGDLYVSRRVEESEAIARTLVDRGYGTI